MNKKINSDNCRGVAVLQNEKLRLEFSKEDGRLLSLLGREKGCHLICAPEGSVPFRLERSNGVDTKFNSFQLSEIDKGLALNWKLSGNVELNAKVTMSSVDVCFELHVENKGQDSLLCIEYPIFTGFKSITEDAKQDYLAHSYATGLLVRNPSKTFENVGDGFRYMPYPESFSGCSMQFFAYYGHQDTGLYFAALDGNGQTKWLNFYKSEYGLEASFIHGYQDIGPGKGISVNYPIVLRSLIEGNWYEAAELYREWAHQQFWVASGKMADRSKSERADWLLKNVGLCTFGINASEDRAKWIKEYHSFVDTPVFHVLGPDWAAGGQRFFGEALGGFDDWFPTKFSKPTIEAIQDVGDYYAPFEFDYLFNKDRADGLIGGKYMQHIPKPAKGYEQYDLPFQCPVPEFTRNLHISRDQQLAKETPLDAIYYDISCNNIINICMDPDHGHPIGGGTMLTQAQNRIYLETKQAMSEQRKRYVPMGTEMINEVHLQFLDYYQARAGAEPNTEFEGFMYREHFKTGDISLIPLFTYIYHEYIPVRMDGWAKLTEEAGELFYYTVARTYLWGGLLELNYEYSPMEAIEGHETSSDVHYFKFPPRGYELSERKGLYLRQFAKLRTGPANEYLSFGKMLRPLNLIIDQVRLPWFHYNCNERASAFEDGGVQTVDAIVHSAWQSQSGNIALFFANVTALERTIQVNTNEHLSSDSQVRLWKFDFNKGWNVVSEWNHDEPILTIPPRTVVFIERIN